MIGNTGTVVDLMAGTGSVAYEFRRNGYTVIASDVMTYSIHHLKTNLLLEQAPPFDGLVNNNVITGEINRYAEVLTYLNTLTPVRGFFRNFHLREFRKSGVNQENTSLRIMPAKLML